MIPLVLRFISKREFTYTLEGGLGSGVGLLGALGGSYMNMTHQQSLLFRTRKICCCMMLARRLGESIVCCVCISSLRKNGLMAFGSVDDNKTLFQVVPFLLAGAIVSAWCRICTERDCAVEELSTYRNSESKKKKKGKEVSPAT